MTEDKKTNNEAAVKAESTEQKTVKAPLADNSVKPADDKRNKFGPKRRFEKRRRRDRPERRQEFEQKIIDIRRVVRVMGGGRRFSFSVAMVIGDKKGRVGIGVGKSNDTSLAIEKATRNAKKNLVTINVTEDMSIAHDVKAKYGASIVEIRPAKGKGLVAGASVRNVLEFAGIKDITAKIMTRSKNKINNSRATINALKQLGEAPVKKVITQEPAADTDDAKKDQKQDK